MNAAASSRCSLSADTDSVCGLAAWLAPSVPASGGSTVQLKSSGADGGELLGLEVGSGAHRVVAADEPGRASLPLSVSDTGSSDAGLVGHGVDPPRHLHLGLAGLERDLVALDGEEVAAEPERRGS